MVDLNEQFSRAAKYIQKHKYDRAIKLYRNLLSSMGNDPKILNKLGDTYLKMDKIEKAMSIFQNLADYYEKNGFYSSAIAVYKKMLRKKNDLSLKLKIADLYVKTGSESEAEYYYKEYSEHFIKKNKIAKAIPAFEKITELKPDNIDLKKELAGFYYHVQNYDRMLEIYQKIFYIFLEEKNEEKLNDIFNTVTAISKDNDLYSNDIYINIFKDYIFHLYDLGENEMASNTALDMSKQLIDKSANKKAKNLLRTILDNDESNIPARIQLISVYEEEGNTAHLVEEYLNMAEIVEQKEPERAKVIYQKVLKYDPDNNVAKKALQEGKPEEKKSKDIKDKMGVELNGVEVSQKGGIKDKLKVDLNEVQEGDKEKVFDKDDFEPTVEVDKDKIQSSKEEFTSQSQGMNHEVDLEMSEEEKSKTEELEEAIQIVFDDYSKEGNTDKSLLNDIDSKSEDLIPKLEDVINSFKKGIEEQLGGDPQNRYDMAIGFKEMGLTDSAIEAFRKLSLFDEYRIKSLNLLAQCLVEKGEYESAIEEFHEVLSSGEITQEERDAILFNLSIAYYEQQSFSQAYDTISKIKDIEVFEKNDYYNKITNQIESEKIEDIDEIESSEKAEPAVEVEGDEIEFELEFEDEEENLEESTEEKTTQKKKVKKQKEKQKSTKVGEEIVNSLTEEINKLKEDNKKLRKAVVVLKDKVVDLEDKQDKKENEDMDEIAKMMEYLHNEQENINKESNKNSKEIAKIKDKLDNISELIKELKKDLNKYEGINKREKEVVSQFMSYKEEFDTISDKIDNIEAKVENQDLSSMKEKIEELNSKIKDIEKGSMKIKTKNKLVENEVDNKKKEDNKEKEQNKDKDKDKDIEKDKDKEDKISFM